MNKNRKYPYVYKRNVYNELIKEKQYGINDFFDEDNEGLFASEELEKYLQLHNINKYSKKNSLSLSKLILGFKDMVFDICNNTYVSKIIPKKYIDSLNERSSSIKKEYFSKVRKVLKQGEIDHSDSRLNNDLGYFGYCLIEELRSFDVFIEGNKKSRYNSYTKKDFDKYKAKLFSMPIKDHDVLIYACMSYDIQFLPFILETLYLENEEKRYFYVEKAISFSKDKSMGSDNSYSIESLFDKFNLSDSKKNFDLLKIIIKDKFNVENINYIEKFGIDDDQDKVELCNIFINKGWFHNLCSSFDLFDIKSEDLKFQVAKKLAKEKYFLGEYLEKFQIKGKKRLRVLADINSGIIEDKARNKKEVINPDFINYAKKFGIKEREFISYVKDTISDNTIFYISNCCINDKILLLQLLSLVIEKSTRFLEKNLEEFFSYANNLGLEEKKMFFTVLSESLSKKGNFQSIIKIIKSLLSEGVIEDDIYSDFLMIFHSVCLEENTVSNYLHRLTNSGYNNTMSPFSFKKDIVIFLDSLENNGYLSRDIKNAILSENNTFESLKNFIFLLFNKFDKEEKQKIDIELDLDKKQSKKGYKNELKNLSRKLFFEKVGLYFPYSKEKYNKKNIQELYLVTYNLYNILGEDFFKDLKIDNNILSVDNLEKFCQFLNSLIGIISLSSNDGLEFIRKEIIDNIKDFNFSSLTNNIPSNKRDLFEKCEFIKQIKTINEENIGFISDIFSDLFLYFFQEKLGIDKKIDKEKFISMIEKWEKIDVLYHLSSHFKGNKKIENIIFRIIETSYLDKFQEYKYNGYYENEYDQEEAEKQIGFLDKSQKEIWKDNKKVLNYYSKDQNKNQNSSFNEMKESVKRLIDNKHLDDLFDGFTEKILNYNIGIDKEKFIVDIQNRANLKDILEKYSSLEEKEIFDLGFIALLKSNKEEEIISSINFIKRFSKEIKIDISNIRLELDSILSKKEILNKEFGESIFFTCETDNPKILLEVGGLVSGDFSCQNYLEGKGQLKALFGYVIDAGVKVLLSFEIKKTDFKNLKSWELFKKKVKNNNYKLRFDEYKLLLEVEDYIFDFNTACYRNIIKLGKNNEKPYLFLENPYKNISGDKKEYVKNIHNELIEEKQKKLDENNLDDFLYSDNEFIEFPETRNPGGVYCDANSCIETGDYSVKINKF